MSLVLESVIHTNCSFCGCRRKKRGDERGEELSKRRENYEEVFGGADEKRGELRGEVLV